MEVEIVLKKIVRGNIVAFSVLVKKGNIIKGFILPVFELKKD
jgi:hypothetical protein